MSNFFTHYVFPLCSRSATISLKTYGSKIIVKPCSSKTAEAIEMVNNEVDSETEQVLIGSLLGDGGLQFQKRSINALFRETHGIKQKEYLIYKKKYFDCFSARIVESKVFDNRKNKYYERIFLWTKTHPLLTKYYHWIYKKNKKTINTIVLDKIGPLALAIWYCDDGSYGYINQNAKIATYLPYEENKMIVDFLKEKYNINCTINKDGESYHIYFSVQEIKKFLNLIKDHVPKCMNYKLGQFSIENIERLNEENLKRKQKDRIRYYRYMANPIIREFIRKQQRENQKRRLENPEYRKKYNEYYKNWKKQKQSDPN